jgi:outer membrane protein assembly factor BamD
MSIARHVKRTTRRLTMIVFAAALVGCSASEVVDPTRNWTPERLYADARDYMDSGNWVQALKQLERLESRYPFGRWAQQAQIDIAYVHYKEGERTLALAAIDRFIKLHPNHPAMDYAVYLKGLINFNEQQGLLASLGGQDLSERDLRAAREAFDSFKELVSRWPDSRYAVDAEQRLRYLVNSMAKGETHIARYYYRRGAYIAAVNRAQNVIRQYPQAPSMEEALAIMVASYDKLGLPDLKEDARRILQRNFPNSTLLAGELPEEQSAWWQVWR